MDGWMDGRIDWTDGDTTAPRLSWGLRLQAQFGTVASPTLVSYYYSMIVQWSTESDQRERQ